MSSAQGESEQPSLRGFSPKATVNIVTWFLLVVSAVAVIVRVTVKRVTAKRLHIDDVLAILSLFTHIGSGVATTIASDNSSFNDDIDLSERHRNRFSQSFLASNLIFIVTVCFAKCSILTLFNILTQTRSHRQVGHWLSALIVAWAVASCVTLGFVCGVPRPWDTVPACQSEVNFWYAFESLNITTDCIIIGYTIFVVWPLKMQRSKRLIALACFGARIFDVGVTIVQVDLTRDFDPSDMSKDLWKWMIVTQLVQCITIITSCIPYMRPLLDALPSGMFMSDETRRKERLNGSNENSYVKMADFGYVLKSSKESKGGSSKDGGREGAASANSNNSNHPYNNYP